MKLAGAETFQSNLETIWGILMDVEKLANITPGLSKLELVKPDEYIATADIKIGPVKGSFAGEMQITHKVEKESFALNVQQKSKIGNVDAVVYIRLNPLDEEQTELYFEGEARMSGLLARTGARVMTGVSKTLSKQFFKNLESELHKT